MSNIKFDKTKVYVGKSGKRYGSGVWFRDFNGNGKYDKGDTLIVLGNRIKNSNGSYTQLNSDGSSTTLYNNGIFTNGVNLPITDIYAITNGMVYGTKAVQDKNKRWTRSNRGLRSWSVDTSLLGTNKAKLITNGYNSIKLILVKGSMQDSKKGTKSDTYLDLNPNGGSMQDSKKGTKSDTYWDLNPNGGSYTRGKYKLTYGQIDDGEGLNGSGYNDVDDAYRKAWLAVNPQAKGHGRWFWGHNAFKKDRVLDISPEYVSQYENDLNNWLSKYYAINPAQNKSVLNADHKYLRKIFTLKDSKGNDVAYVPLFTGDLWGFGVREYMDASGNDSYKDYNGDDITGLIMKNGKPYIPAEPTGNYFKCGGKLIKRKSYGILRKFN